MSFCGCIVLATAGVQPRPSTRLTHLHIPASNHISDKATAVTHFSLRVCSHICIYVYVYIYVFGAKYVKYDPFIQHV